MGKKNTTYKRTLRKMKRKGVPPKVAKKIARSKQNRKNARKGGK